MNSKYYPFILITLGVLITSAIFLLPNYWEFPMDDGYIHFVYVRNLLENGQLFFNSPNEVAVGSTSLLWVLLLAVLKTLGLSLHLAAKGLGVISLIISGVAIFTLLKEHWSKRVSLLAALVATLSGNMIWFSLSGMETSLFVAIGLVSLVLYQQKKWILLGFGIGLLTLTRPEGLLLLPTIGIVELFIHKRIPWHLTATVISFSVIALPWFIYLFARTGHIIPTSGIGRQSTVELGYAIVGEKTGWLHTITQIAPITYVIAWCGYFLQFVFGSQFLPGPFVTLPDKLANLGYQTSVWGIVIALTLLIPTFVYISRNIQKLKLTHTQAAIGAFVTWVVIHNIAYIIALPIPGTGSRYGAINHLFVWVAIVLVSFSIKSKLWHKVMVGILILAWVFNISYWNTVYDSNLRHTHQVRIPAGQYLKTELADKNCAAFDIGAVKYFGEQSFLDLGGLTDLEVVNAIKRNSIPTLLQERMIDCLIMPAKSTQTDTGWIDYVTLLGIDNSDILSIHEVKSFEMEYSDWVYGYLPSGNAQARVAIYDVTYLPSFANSTKQITSSKQFHQTTPAQHPHYRAF